MKKFILSLIFISLISSQVFAFQGSDNLEIIKKNAALQLVRNNHHNSERIKISNPFQFNYEKKKEKTTVRSYPIEPGNRDPMDVKINGEDQATITQGDDFVVTIYFSDGCSEANISMWADMNGNEIWEDSIDLLVPDTEDEILDNGLDDEDPTVGVYQITFYGDEDGPNRVSNLGLFFVAEDTGGIDAAYLWIDPITSDYSVSGLVTPTAPNVIIAAVSSEENMWMTATDASGNYQNFVPIVTDYMVMAFDPLDVLGGGMFPDTVYVDVNINSHITGYDFNFVLGNATIEGTVLDENGAPVVGVTVYAGGQMPGGVSTETDEFGYYNLTVIEGWWEVEPSWDSLIPDYLCAEDVEVYVEEGGTETVDFLVYETDSTIEGTVYLDDVPTAGFEIDSWSELGMTETESGANGNYILHVASEANALGGYCVNVDIEDIPGVYVVEYYNNIISGSTGIDFHIYTVTGGIEGHVYDSVTQEPAEDCWVNAFDGTNWYGTGVNDEGFYQLYLPNGTFEVSAEGEMYYQQTVEDIVIEDAMV
ncbi:MAG: carboxypeptidase regulatory-like domain-containing protein, partial [Candidatus Cloacimonetes bacterium]|nr:carboxypeptidase regulatory-like domain-containing protein [Candidatus Cloacimonadota bacterium]